MIGAITALLGCQLLGEILVRALFLPLPGPVAGLGLMFGFLILRGRRIGEAGSVPDGIGVVSDVLLRNLSLLFVPAAVGVVQYLGLLRTYAGPIAFAIVVSTIATLAVTAATFRLASHLHTRRHGGAAEDVGDVIDVIDVEPHP